MERVQGQEQDILDTFKVDTRRCFEMFCAEYEIENLRVAPQNTFESALSYTGDNIFLMLKNKTFKYASVLTHLYSGKPPCPIAHQTALSSVNDATASPLSSVLLMNNRSAEFRQI